MGPWTATPSIPAPPLTQPRRNSLTVVGAARGNDNGNSACDSEGSEEDGREEDVVYEDDDNDDDTEGAGSGGAGAAPADPRSRPLTLLAVAERGPHVDLPAVRAGTSFEPSTTGNGGQQKNKKKKRGIERFCGYGTLDSRDTAELAKINWRWSRGLLPAATYAIQVQAHNDRG